MRYFLSINLILLSIFSFGQEVEISIDTSNYYDYANTVVHQDWLRIGDVVPIIIDELVQAGYSSAFIKIGELIKIDDSTRFVLTVSFLKEPKFGFVYDGYHMIPVSKADRDFMSSNNNEGFIQFEKNTNGETNFIKIAKLPKNIFLLKQTCYWYEAFYELQEGSITKTIAENILRQDVRKYLQQVKDVGSLNTLLKSEK